MARLPNITVKYNVPFPARVRGIGPISVEKDGGVWLIGNDYTQLQQFIPPEADLPYTYVVTLDTVTGLYNRVSFEDLLNSTQTALPCAIEFLSDGNSQVIQGGIKGYVEVPFDATIQQVSLLADKAGSCEVDLWRCTRANFAPPTHPVVGDSITGGNYPTIVAGTSDLDDVLTGWTTSLAEGDILAFNIRSIATITRLTFSIQLTRDVL